MQRCAPVAAKTRTTFFECNPKTTSARNKFIRPSSLRLVVLNPLWGISVLGCNNTVQPLVCVSSILQVRLSQSFGKSEVFIKNKRRSLMYLTCQISIELRAPHQRLDINYTHSLIFRLHALSHHLCRVRLSPRSTTCRGCAKSAGASARRPPTSSTNLRDLEPLFQKFAVTQGVRYDAQSFNYTYYIILHSIG